jgi:hypothetical protein
VTAAANEATATRGRVWESSQGSHVAKNFWWRLWHTPWLAPALGAASVATVVLLVRVLNNPQVLPEQKPAATETLVPVAAEPAASPPEEESKPALLPLLGHRIDKKAAAESYEGARGESRRAAGLAKPRAATPVPSNLPAVGRRSARLSDDDLFGQVEEAQARAPSGEARSSKGGLAAPAPNKAPAAEKETAPLARVRKAEASPAASSVTAAPSGAVGAGVGASNRWAEPPPPRPAPAPASAASPAVAAPAPAKKAMRVPTYEDQLEGAPQESARSTDRAKSQAPMREPAASAAAEASADKKDVGKDKDSVSLEERVRKAEKLFAEKKWAEAAAAFRALIAQAPSNPAVKTWRERMVAAEGAQEQTRAARAKKAISNDPLEGL